MKLAWLITILLATRCHCMYVCAAVIVENKQTNKQKNTHRHVELLITSRKALKSPPNSVVSNPQ